jgi:hypothetical protein
VRSATERDGVLDLLGIAAAVLVEPVHVRACVR